MLPVLPFSCSRHPVRAAVRRRCRGRSGGLYDTWTTSLGSCTGDAQVQQAHSRRTAGAQQAAAARDHRAYRREGQELAVIQDHPTRLLCQCGQSLAYPYPAGLTRLLGFRHRVCLSEKASRPYIHRTLLGPEQHRAISMVQPLGSSYSRTPESNPLGRCLLPCAAQTPGAGNAGAGPSRIMSLTL